MLTIKYNLIYNLIYNLYKKIIYIKKLNKN